MCDGFWLTVAQVQRPRPFFPRRRGRARVDDRRVLGGIIHVRRNGLGNRLVRKDAPAAHGRPKILHNRWSRWSRMGVFARVLLEPAAGGQDADALMIDATHVEAHRTASSLWGEKGASGRGAAGRSGGPRAV